MDEVIVFKYSDYKILNKKLLIEAKNTIYSWTDVTNIRGKMSEWYISGKYINIIKNWIISLVQNKNNKTVWCTDCWYAKYDYGDHALLHNHGNVDLSFVYYVNTPKGSSPLVFPTLDKKIKAEEGNLVLFNGNLKHSVPKNNCKNRVIIAGNLNLITIIVS
jgi:hypothetical protein